jgi:hypothetical protein
MWQCPLLFCGLFLITRQMLKASMKLEGKKCCKSFKWVDHYNWFINLKMKTFCNYGTKQMAIFNKIINCQSFKRFSKSCILQMQAQEEWVMMARNGHLASEIWKECLTDRWASGRCDAWRHRLPSGSGPFRLRTFKGQNIWNKIWSLLCLVTTIFNKAVFLFLYSYFLHVAWTEM